MKPQTKDPTFLTPAEAASRLNVPVSWVYKQTDPATPGAIPSVKVGKYLRISSDELDAWIAAHRRTAV